MRFVSSPRKKKSLCKITLQSTVPRVLNIEKKVGYVRARISENTFIWGIRPTETTHTKKIQTGTCVLIAWVVFEQTRSAGTPIYNGLTMLGLEVLLQRVHAGHFFGTVHANVLVRRFRRCRTFRAPRVGRKLLAEMMRRSVVLCIE